MVWKLNMDTLLGCSGTPRYSYENDEAVNQGNTLDDSIMVDLRKVKNRYQIDDYEVDNEY